MLAEMLKKYGFPEADRVIKYPHGVEKLEAEYDDPFFKLVIKQESKNRFTFNQISFAHTNIGYGLTLIIYKQLKTKSDWIAVRNFIVFLKGE